MFATTTVPSDMNTAPSAGERSTPHAARAPAASGIAMMLEDDVVAGGPPQVLQHRPVRGARAGDDARAVARIAAHEHRVARLERDGGAGADRDADLVGGPVDFDPNRRAGSSAARSADSYQTAGPQPWQHWAPDPAGRISTKVGAPHPGRTRVSLRCGMARTWRKQPRRPEPGGSRPAARPYGDASSAGSPSSASAAGSATPSSARQRARYGV